MEVIDLTPELLETILLTFSTDNEKELTCQIVRLFMDCGFPVKVKQYHQACIVQTNLRETIMNYYFSILLYHFD